MNEFQLGLKLQLSGVDAAEGMLNGFTKSLDQQLEGIKGFTKQLGQGNDTVRGYIDSAKKMIEQNPIGETMGKLSGLAKTLGLDQVATGIADTGNSVRAWSGELTSFLGSAQGASATIKQVLQGDVNGAINSVKTGLGSLGSMADLANKMGLPGVAAGIKDIAANVGSWVGKVQEFQGATEATAAKLNTAFGGSIHPNVLKVTSGLMEMTGVSKDILPHLDGMMKQFEGLTGKSFPEAFKGMQDLSKEFGNGGLSASKLGEMLKTPMGPSQALAGGLGIVGAAIAGWQIGKAIGDMDLFGVKINDVAQYSIAKGMEAFEKFKGWLHINSKEETEKAAKAWRDAADQATMNKPEAKKEAASGGFDQKKVEQDQLKESQRNLAVTQADKVKEEADKQAAAQLAAIDKTFKENTNVNDTYLEERLEAANKAEQDSLKVLHEREAAAQKALDVRVQNIKDKLAEVEKSGGSKEQQEATRNNLQSQLIQLEQQKTNVHEEGERQRAETSEKFANARQNFTVEEDKRIQEQKRKEEEEAKRKAEEQARAQAAAAKQQEDELKRNIELIEKQNKELDEQIEKLEELAAKTKDEKGKAALKQKITEKKDQKDKLPGKLNAPSTGVAFKPEGEDAGGKKGDAAGNPKDKAKEVLTLGQQIQQTFDDIANTGIKSVQDSITGVINGTMTWKDALNHIGSTVINSVMNAFSKMITDQITQYMAVDTVKATTSTAEIGRAEAETAAKSPLALLDSISSWGFAATIGLSALMAAMNAIGGFESGGYTGDGGRSELAGLVHRGEMVFDQPAVQAIGKDRLEAMRMNRAMPTGLASGGASGGGAKPMSPNINVQAAQPKVIVVNSQEELMKVMKGSIGEEITVAHIAKNKLRLGMAS